MTAFDEVGVDETKSINGKSITVGWLLESLRENDKVFQRQHGNQKVKNITVTDICGGKGISSGILKCYLTFINSDQFYTTILKIPGMEGFADATGVEDDAKEAMMEMSNSFVEVHQSECDFYNHLAIIVKIPIPKVHKTQEWIPGKQDGCIHMEDLSGHGKTLTFFDEISLAQIQTVIRHIAKMHKNILECDPQIWEGKFVKGSASFDEFLGMIIPTIEEFVEKSGGNEQIKSMFKKLDKFLRNKSFLQYVYMDMHKDHGIRQLVVHGDLHLGNILWKTNADGKVTDEVAAFIDWQICHQSSPMNDVGRFLVMSTTGNGRREAEKFAIDYYFECLKKEYNGEENTIPYTLDQLRMSYNYVFVSQLLLLIAASVFFLNNIEKAEANKDNQEKYRKIAIEKVTLACEDAIQLLEGELKDVFEKYGM